MPSEDAYTAKKRSNVEEDDDEISIGSMLNRKKKTNANSGSKLSLKVKKESEQSFDSDKNVKARSKVTKVKSEVKDEEEDVDIKPILRKLSAAKPKAKNDSGAEKKRPVYELPGQKRESPEERDPSRVFYETLLEQNPRSEMAQIWMMEYGLLTKELAAEVFERHKKKKTLSSPAKVVKKQTVSAGVKKTTPSLAKSSDIKKPSKAAETAKPTKKRKKSDESEEDYDDDFIISRTAKKKR